MSSSLWRIEIVISRQGSDLTGTLGIQPFQVLTERIDGDGFIV